MVYDVFRDVLQKQIDDVTCYSVMSNGLFEHFGHGSTKHQQHSLSEKRSRKGLFRSASNFVKQQLQENLINPEEIEPLVSTETDTTSKEEHHLCNVKASRIRQRSRITATLPSRTNLSDCESFDNAVLDNFCEQPSADPFLRNEFFILDVQKGDSLQSLSLKYHCAIADLKRANNLISSQEFYALRHVRIPVKKYGMLTEKLPSFKSVEPNQPTAIDENGFGVKTVHVGIGPITHSGSQQEAVAFFQKMDEDLIKIMQNTKTQKDSLEDAAVALTSPRIQPLVKDPCNGVDCGIQWCHLIIVLIIIGLILPVIGALYLYMKSSDHFLTNDSIAQESKSGS